VEPKDVDFNTFAGSWRENFRDNFYAHTIRAFEKIASDCLLINLKRVSLFKKSASKAVSSREPSAKNQKISNEEKYVNFECVLKMPVWSRRCVDVVEVVVSCPVKNQEIDWRQKMARERQVSEKILAKFQNGEIKYLNGRERSAGERDFSLKFSVDVACGEENGSYFVNFEFCCEDEPFLKAFSDFRTFFGPYFEKWRRHVE